MIRPLLVALLLSSSAQASASTAGGPPIAYVKRMSNGDEIHLVSPGNDERLQIYKAKSKVQITMLDLRPGGGEVAFLEGFTTLKILAFDHLGRAEAGNPREIRRTNSPCSVESPDYHPSNGSLLFVEGCGRDRAVWTVRSGANQRDATPLFSTAVFRARWSASGSSIYHIGLRPNAASSDPAYLNRWADGAQTEIGRVDNWQTFDVARVGDKVFWGGNDSFWMLDFATGSTTADAPLLACPRGTRMTRSPNDTQAAFQSPWARGRGNYLMIGATDCLSDPRALTGAGEWGPLDWRL